MTEERTLYTVTNRKAGRAKQTRTITALFPIDLAEDVRVACARMDIKVSEFMRRAAKAYLTLHPAERNDD